MTKNRIAKPHRPLRPLTKTGGPTGSWIVELQGGTGGGGDGGGGTPTPNPVTAVTGEEIGPHYVDRQLGQHTVIKLTPTLTHPATDTDVTFWVQFGDGVWVRQGVWLISQSKSLTDVTIGKQTWGTEGEPLAGNIWVPTSDKRRTWKVSAADGNVNTDDPPDGAPVGTFDVIPVAACRADDCTNIQFLINPATGDEMIYALRDPGQWFWFYFELDWTTPEEGHDENYWFSMCTCETGYTDSDGVWHTYPDQWGSVPHDDTLFIGRPHHGSGDVQGGAPVLGSIIKLVGHPDDSELWPWPVTQTPDGTPNPWRTVRFRVYAVSRAGTDADGPGGSSIGGGVYTLQPGWPGGADHYDLTPAQQPWALNLSLTNPNTSFTAPLAVAIFHGGAGDPLDLLFADPLENNARQIALKPKGVDTPWIADDAVKADQLSVSAIGASGALQANAVVDGLVKLPVGQLVYGSAIFTGDVYLSQGSSKPVIGLTNSAITLFGAAGSDGASGLLSQPYTQVTAGNVLLYAGGASNIGAAAILDGSGIALYSRNDANRLQSPYMALTASGLSLIDWPYYRLDIGATGIVMTYDSYQVIAPTNPSPVNPHVIITNSLNSNGMKLLATSSASATLVPSFIVNPLYLQFFSKDGDSNYPCIGIQSTQVSLVYGQYQTVLTATAVQLAYTGTQTSTVTLTSASVEIAKAANNAKITLDNSGTATFLASGVTSSIQGGNIDTQNVTIHNDLYNSGSSELTGNVTLAGGTAPGGGPPIILVGRSDSNPALDIRGVTYGSGGTIQYFLAIRINGSAGLIPIYSF